MGLSVTVDNNSLGLIVDSEKQRLIGTGFVCLRWDWFFTAKHVVLNEFNEPIGSFANTSPNAGSVYGLDKIDRTKWSEGYLQQKVCRKSGGRNNNQQLCYYQLISGLTEYYSAFVVTFNI